jgi:DNA polymerase-4
LEAPTDHTDIIWHAAAELFERWVAAGIQPVRLLGMGVSQLLNREGQQLGLFGQEDARRRQTLDRTLDEIRERFGRDSISRGELSRRKSGDAPTGGNS